MNSIWRVVSAVVISAAALAAQQTGNTPAVYSSTMSYLVPDENRVTYESLLKDKTRKFALEYMKEEPNLQAVIVTNTLYGGHSTPEANYFVTWFWQGVPPSDNASLERVSQKLFGKGYEAMIKETYGPLRKRIGQSLARQWAATPRNVDEGDVIIIDRKKISEGRFGDYIQLEQRYQTLREAQVKAGKMKAWSMWSVVMPRGTEEPFDAYTTHVGKDMQQALTWGQGMAAIAAQISPPFDMTGLAMRSQMLSKTVRSDARKVVMVARRP